MSQRPPQFYTVIAVAVVLTLVFLSRTFFVVRVDQFAIVTQFGKPVRTLTEPGLYLRIPLVQEVKKLDKRIRGWDDQQWDTKTNDSRQIDYTVYARWQVAEPLTFYTAVGTEKRAHGVMDSIVTGRIQTKIRNNRLASIVRETGRQFEARASVDPRSIFDVYQECNPEVNPEFRKTLSDSRPNRGEATGGEQAMAMRSKLVEEILVEANKELVPDYGIRLRDLHFKYLNYATQVHGDIIRQIQADRNDDISAYLEIGQKCVGYINRITDAERGEILGSGESRVRELDGEAIAKAIDIKATAFGESPDLYVFLKNLELVESALGEQTRLVLSTDNPVLSLLTAPPKLPTGKKAPAPEKKVEPAPEPEKKVEPAPDEPAPVEPEPTEVIIE